MKGYRTLALNALGVAIFAILPAIGINIPQPSPQISATALAVLNLVLRFFTTTKIGEK